AASRLRVLVVGLAAFLVIAAALTIWALNQSQVAQSNATRADQSAETALANQNEADTQRGLAVQSAATARADFTRAEAQKLAADANALLSSDGDREAAALLSVRSMRTLYTPAGDSAMLQVAEVLESPLKQFGKTGDAPPRDVAFSPD